MKRTIPKLLTLVCLLVAIMGLSIVTAHAATVTGTISGGNEYRYHEDKTPVPQWGAFTSTKLKYFTRDDTGVTVPAYCMEPSVRSAGGDLSYSSTSWSSLSWNQRYAVTLALSYGYGGNYDFYRERKRIEEEALAQQVDSEQTALRLARKKAQEVRERQERRMRQGERHKDQLPRILRRTMKDSGERTKAQLVGKHAELIDGSRERLDELRRRQRTQCELKIDFDDAQLHDGKLLVRADGLNFEYAPGRPLWREPLALEIRSGERIRLTGDNGTGKTTLVRLLTGELEPTAGRIGRADFSYVCLDQQYSRVNTPQSVLELAQSCNHGNLQDHELKLRLHRALFGQQMWDKRCDTLSGGERMRLCLCSLMIANHVPDLFVLDEPTNNLDLSSLAILTRTVRNYRGTLLVVSHDDNFTREIGITRTVGLESPPAE